MLKQERWIKWEPIRDINTVYAIDEIVDNLDGLEILLVDSDNDKTKIRVFFQDSVSAHRCTEESYRLNIKSLFVQPNGENLYGVWGFFDENRLITIELFG